MTDCTIAIQEKKTKRPAWTRVADIILRTAHVAMIGIVFGGAFFGVAFSRLILWNNLVIATGCGLIASEVYHCRHWFYQGSGVLGLIHIGLFGLIRLRPGLAAPLLTLSLILGMMGSHLPKKFRHWSFVHGRVMD
ncbi:MAG: hypothetical protein EHM45_12930 [Desulfobacteraceae bacterium]|nr:MAG: hypothetical protein EHM45_12930 [Desulfobacteraceae bacterium]